MNLPLHNIFCNIFYPKTSQLPFPQIIAKPAIERPHVYNFMFCNIFYPKPSYIPLGHIFCNIFDPPILQLPLPHIFCKLLYRKASRPQLPHIPCYMFYHRGLVITIGSYILRNLLSKVLHLPLPHIFCSIFVQKPRMYHCILHFSVCSFQKYCIYHCLIYCPIFSILRYRI